ncbi:Serine/threonine-protein kinase haspin [Halotydeus destructor]|nr:Serine/threonine-protein kinase haspin [Halotydeus destructor]
MATKLSKSVKITENQPTLPKSARLFDEIFGDVVDRRAPLTLLQLNSNEEDVVITSRTRRRKAEPKVRFRESTCIEEESEKSYKKKKPTKTRNRKALPVCSKNALIKAFEKANLPDFDKIAKHELVVSKATPGKESTQAKPETPPFAELIKQFEESYCSEEGTKLLRNNRRPRQRAQPSPFLSGTPDIPTFDNQSTVPVIDITPPEPSRQFSNRYLKNPKLKKIFGTSTPVAMKQESFDPMISVIQGSGKSTTNAVRSNLIRIPYDAEFVRRRGKPGSQLYEQASTPVRANTRKNFTIRENITVMSKDAQMAESISLSGCSKSASVGSSGKHETVVDVFKRPTDVLPRLSSQDGRSNGSEDSVEKLAELRRASTPNDNGLRRSQTVSCCARTIPQPDISKYLLGGSDDTKSFSAPVMNKTKVKSCHQSVRRCRNVTILEPNREATKLSITTFDDSVVRTVKTNVSRKCSNLDLTGKEMSRTKSKASVAQRQSCIRELLENSFAAAFGDTRIIGQNGQEELLSHQDKVLALCEPDFITKFASVFTRDIMKNLKKIGEGSYGEIYKSLSVDGTEIVLKVVPCSLEVETDEAFGQILPELMISKTFNSLRNSEINQTPNFINMMQAACVKGKFPKKLLDEWDAFDQEKTSENMDPREYPSDHLHVVMVLNNGGMDLEKYVFKSAVEAKSIIVQVALSLAAAECEYQFEHRDLHWGNILIMQVPESQLEYAVDGVHYSVDSNGLLASVIDFTLSRMAKDGVIIHDDLEKYPDLYQGKGDYQFDVYRMMREANGGDWESFTPKSNIFWLHYLLEKVIVSKKYKSRSKVHIDAMADLKRLRQMVLNYSSVQEFVECPKAKEFIY